MGLTSTVTNTKWTLIGCLRKAGKGERRREEKGRGIKEGKVSILLPILPGKEGLYHSVVVSLVVKREQSNPD